MKTITASNRGPLRRTLFTLLLGIAALWGMPISALGENGSVGEYNATTGAAINANFIPTGLNSPNGLALSGNTLFVTSETPGTVGEYNATTGAAINPNFITGLYPLAIALSGNTLFVANFTPSTDRVSEYDATTGAVINANFITGLNHPRDLALSGNNLFVASLIAPIPEPSIWALIAFGGAVLLGIMLGKKHRTA